MRTELYVFPKPCRPRALSLDRDRQQPVVLSELLRRIIRMRLDAGVERPDLRTGFRHPDLKLWAHEHRDLLLFAVLDNDSRVDRSWPSAWRVTLGGFEAWSNTMGGILEVTGIPGFLANINEYRQEADYERAHTARLHRALVGKVRDAAGQCQ